MLQITIVQRRYPKPITAMTPDDLYDAGRSAWVLGSKADKERYALIVFNDTVLQAIEIEQLEDVDAATASGRPQVRRAIHGRIMGPGEPVYDTFVGKQAPMPSTQNPIKYVSHPLDFTECRCGCGQRVRAEFLPGHDQRAIHERIAKIGTVAEFLDWFDTTYKA